MIRNCLLKTATDILIFLENFKFDKYYDIRISNYGMIYLLQPDWLENITTKSSHYYINTFLVSSCKFVACT